MRAVRAYPALSRNTELQLGNARNAHYLRSQNTELQHRVLRIQCLKIIRAKIKIRKKLSHHKRPFDCNGDMAHQHQLNGSQRRPLVEHREALRDLITGSSIDLGSQGIDDDDAEFVANLLASLGDKINHDEVLTLDFFLNGIGPRGVAALAEVIPKLKVPVSVDFDCNAAGSLGLAAIVEKCVDSLCKLSIAHNGVGRRGAILLGGALMFNKTLTHLDLRGNRIGSQSAMVFAHSLEVNTTIRSLSLSRNCLGDDGMIGIIKALARGRSKLQELHLSKNRITDRGCLALAQILSMKSPDTKKETGMSLRTLELVHNHIGCAGIEALVDSLHVINGYNRNLQNLALHWNAISWNHPVFERLEYYQDRNKNLSGLSLLLDERNSRAVWPSVLERLVGTDAERRFGLDHAYILIRNAPDLIPT